MSKLKIFTCVRCGHEWASLQDRPIICPHCKSAYYDKARVFPKREAKR